MYETYVDIYIIYAVCPCLCDTYMLHICYTTFLSPSTFLNMYSAHTQEKSNQHVDIFPRRKAVFSMIVVQNRRQCCVATQWHQDHKGELSALVQKMHIMDEEKHYLYFWMPATKSDVVARSIGECIQPQTPHRAQINVVERSAVTLHYLALGCLHVSAHWGGVLFQR